MPKLVSISGQGYGYSNETGKFEVKYGNTAKSFDVLKEAVQFYEKLNEPAAIWDITSIPELLNSKDFVE